MFLINPSDLGAIALFGVASSSALVAGFSLFTRDNDAFTDEEAVAAATYAPGASIWPIVFALGAALVLTGLATVPVVFILGIGVLFGAGLEWTIQNWSQRASADTAFNSFVRERAIGALEYPGLAAVGLAIIAYLFSRIFLALSKDAGTIFFIGVAAVIFAVGFMIAFKPAMRGRATVLVSVAGAVALLVVGGIAAMSGERDELAVASAEDHYSAEHRECEVEKSEHYDHHANNQVSLRSAVTATIFVEDGKLRAQAIGIKKDVDTITIPRSLGTTLIFRNLDETERRLVVNLGSHTIAETGVKEKLGTCTQLTGKKQEQVLTLTIPKPATAEEPYFFEVPGIEGQIKLVVP
jgi:hypothetical protein